jgi:hypothetical protein
MPPLLAWRTPGLRRAGAVFTRREIVDFILDLAGYTGDKPLHRAKLLEPPMGQGDFLPPAINRLLESYRSEVGGRGDVVSDFVPRNARKQLNTPWIP